MRVAPLQSHALGPGGVGMNGKLVNSPPTSARRETKDEWLTRHCHKLKEGQSVNTTERYSNGDTLMHALVKYDVPKGVNKSECITRLLALGSDPNALDWAGETALMIAARGTQLPAIKVLGNSPAALLDAPDREGNSALFHAISSKSLTVVELVLHAAYPKERHRMLTQRNNLGQTPKVFAEASNLPHIASFLHKGKEEAERELEAMAEESKAAAARAVAKTKLQRHKTIDAGGWLAAGKGDVSPGSRSPTKRGGSPKAGRSSSDKFAESVVAMTNANKARKRFLGLVGLFTNRPKDRDKERDSTTS